MLHLHISALPPLDASVCVGSCFSLSLPTPPLSRSESWFKALTLDQTCVKVCFAAWTMQTADCSLCERCWSILNPLFDLFCLHRSKHAHRKPVELWLWSERVCRTGPGLTGPDQKDTRTLSPNTFFKQTPSTDRQTYKLLIIVFAVDSSFVGDNAPRYPSSARSGFSHISLREQRLNKERGPNTFTQSGQRANGSSDQQVSLGRLQIIYI